MSIIFFFNFFVCNIFVHILHFNVCMCFSHLFNKSYFPWLYAYSLIYKQTLHIIVFTSIVMMILRYLLYLDHSKQT